MRHTPPPTPVQGKRLKQRLLSDADSKLSLRLSIAREVLNTGARDETEGIWTKLPYPRAQRYWTTLRRSLTSTMPLDAVGGCGDTSALFRTTFFVAGSGTSSICTHVLIAVNQSILY